MKRGEERRNETRREGKKSEGKRRERRKRKYNLPCPRNASCKEHGTELGDASRVQFQALRDSLQ